MSNQVATGHIHEPVVPDKRIYFKPVPNLYIYDHCPFCVKARMIFGIRNIKVNLIYFANDDFDGPTNLIGKKGVPILEYTHTGKRVIMPESADIVYNVDTHPDFQPAHVHPHVAEGKKTDEINSLWKNPAFSDLLFIVTPERINLGEFQSKESRQTFAKRHKLSDGASFNSTWKRYDQLVRDTNEILKKFDALVESEEHVTGKEWTWDDLNIFAYCRGLTGVQGLQWPPKLKNFLMNISKITDIPLYFTAPVSPDTRDAALADF